MTAIAHGYTLHDLEHLTRTVLRMDRWYIAGDGEERYNAVWFGITEHLLTASEPPTRRELLNAGTRANDERVKDHMRTHGRCTQTYGKAMPRFHAYWNPANPPSPEPRVVEQLAVQQIWPLLQPRQQAALTALATTGDYEQAAAAIGATKATFQVLISAGRRRFYAWWHEHETPSRQWRTDRRVRSRDGRDHLGRRRLTTVQIDTYRQRRDDGEPVKALAAEAGIAAASLYRLLKGASKPAQETT